MVVKITVSSCLVCLFWALHVARSAFDSSLIVIALVLNVAVVALLVSEMYVCWLCWLGIVCWVGVLRLELSRRSAFSSLIRLVIVVLSLSYRSRFVQSHHLIVLDPSHLIVLSFCIRPISSSYRSHSILSNLWNAGPAAFRGKNSGV